MSDSLHSPFAIEALIAARLQDLKLTPVELVRRDGYKNVSKGLRRLEALREGHFERADWLIQHLPQALQVPAETVQNAVDDTRNYLHDVRRLGGHHSCLTPL